MLTAGHSASLHTLINGLRWSEEKCSGGWTFSEPSHTDQWTSGRIHSLQCKDVTSTAMAYYVDRAGERCVFKQAKSKAVTFQETRRVSTTGRCCAKSGLLLARLLGRSTCLLSGPWGLLFVADLWGPGRPSQLSASFLADACV